MPPCRDEPTSGLDARGAGLVMRAVKATVSTGGSGLHGTAQHFIAIAAWRVPAQMNVLQASRAFRVKLSETIIVDRLNSPQPPPPNPVCRPYRCVHHPPGMSAHTHSQSTCNHERAALMRQRWLCLVFLRMQRTALLQPGWRAPVLAPECLRAAQLVFPAVFSQFLLLPLLLHVPSSCSSGHDILAVPDALKKQPPPLVPCSPRSRFSRPSPSCCCSSAAARSSSTAPWAPMPRVSSPTSRLSSEGGDKGS